MISKKSEEVVVVPDFPRISPDFLPLALRPRIRRLVRSISFPSLNGESRDSNPFLQFKPFRFSETAQL